MTTITKEEFISWIMAQPYDRRVNMSNCNTAENDPKDCGCLMVEWYRDHGDRGLLIHCSFREIYQASEQNTRSTECMIREMDFEITDLIDLMIWPDIKTFGDAQAMLTS